MLCLRAHLNPWLALLISFLSCYERVFLIMLEKRKNRVCWYGMYVMWAILPENRAQVLYWTEKSASACQWLFFPSSSQALWNVLFCLLWGCPELQSNPIILLNINDTLSLAIASQKSSRTLSLVCLFFCLSLDTFLYINFAEGRV